MNSTRTSNGYGVDSISYSEIEAYYKLSKIEPEAWEIEVLKYFDNTLMKLYSDKAEADQAKSKNKK